MVCLSSSKMNVFGLALAEVTSTPPCAYAFVVSPKQMKRKKERSLIIENY